MIYGNKLVSDICSNLKQLQLTQTYPFDIVSIYIRHYHIIEFLRLDFCAFSNGSSNESVISLVISSNVFVLDAVC